MQQVDVQRVALDPLAAVEQPPQRRDRGRPRHPAGVLDRRARAQLVGDRADPADPGGDVRSLGEAPAPSSASKKRGGSKIVSATSVTTPSARRTCSEPSPSTRASPSTPIGRESCRRRRGSSAPDSAVLAATALVGGRPGAPALKVRNSRDDVDRRAPSPRQRAGQRGGVRRLGRAEAPEAATVDRRAQRPAARPSHRAEARRAAATRAGRPCRAPCTPGRRCARRSPARRPARGRVITSSSWWRSIGQPWSSKSTATWAAIGVEVASVEMYSGWA